MFNLAKFILYYKAKQDEYLALMLSKLEEGNPGWIEKLKKDKDLFDEKGDPKQIDENLTADKVKSLVESHLNAPQISKEEIYNHFIVDKDLLDKFMME